MDNKGITLLVVDDEPEIRMLIADYLEDDEGYTVLTAENGKDALDNVLSAHKVDLVLSDINMPVMKGFELLHEVRERYPETKRVLITAYNVEDYIDMALKYDVGNIFVKTTPFNFDELSSMLTNLLSEDIFGVGRYLEPGFEQRCFAIKRGDALDKDVKQITEVLPPGPAGKKLNLVLVELLTNAIFYGIRKENPERKEEWDYEFELFDSDAIQITAGWDSRKYAISITDNGGRLQKKDVLYWLHRQVAHDDAGVPVGIGDSHGRGFFIARRYIDRLVINIAPAKKTEVVIINYTAEVYQGSKPLYINEI
ncbi:MAG: response regulator [Chitinivibrionales bacterium]|nr:response regulator [Chitinivibrionales bacterium]MBD3397199.1 response regulator [Chitinivibrionales bacterium]